MELKIVPGVSTSTRITVAIEAMGRCQFWYDQYRRCDQSLLERRPEGKQHVAEFAHIYSKKPKGPRYHADLRGPNEEWNLLLMCADHHRRIDKAWDIYPAELLLDWKQRDYDPRIALAIAEAVEKMMRNSS